MALLWSLMLILIGPAAWAQSAAPAAGDERSRGAWVDFRQATYRDRPLLLHLRSGHERAVVMPEPISLLNDGQRLPGCAVAIEHDVVGFFATRDFDREAIRFVGLDSGTVYEFQVRASPEGFEQTLQIAR